MLIFFFSGSVLISLGIVGWIYTKSENKKDDWSKRFEKQSLNLSESQKREMDSLRLDLQKKMKPIQLKARQARIELMELVKDPSPDKNAIMSKQAEITQLQSDIQKLVVDNLLQMKNILSPDQQKVLFDTMCTGFCGGHGLKDYTPKGGKCNTY
jgi:Spy/CpxP family protein refolding chaperone